METVTNKRAVEALIGIRLTINNPGEPKREILFEIDKPVPAKAYDEQDRKWYKSQITYLSDGQLLVKDIDPASNWPGLEWKIGPTDLLNEKELKF
jgi:hypothetical protein